MNLVFWTSSIDFHTHKVINYFGEHNKVIIAYFGSSHRGHIEYAVPNCEKCKIQDKKDILELLDRTSYFIHVSNAFKVMPQHQLMKTALKLTFKRRYELISLFQESFPTKGLRGFLRKLKWSYVYNFGLGRRHKLIGYCGGTAYAALRQAHVKKSRLAEFLYTPWYEDKLPLKVTDIVTFIIVGQLVPRKAVIQTIQILKRQSSDFKLKIIGDGIQKDEVKSLIQGDQRFEYLGSLQPNEVQRQYIESDFLLLPSLFDGWGCSANEAISQGCKVIISEDCGARHLVKLNPSLGYIFGSLNWAQYEDYITSCIENGPISLEDKDQIRDWAEKAINPKGEAQYLEDLLFHIYNNRERPIAPWYIQK